MVEAGVAGQKSLGAGRHEPNQIELILLSLMLMSRDDSVLNKYDEYATSALNLCDAK